MTILTSHRTTDDLLEDFERYRPYLTNGGLTVTGGEPMLQMDFLLELFTKAKEKNIHTCIDTSGIVFNRKSDSFMAKLDTLLKVTDLIMLDIKHIDDIEHEKLTAQSNRNILDFVSDTGKRQRYTQVDGEDDAPARSHAPGSQSKSRLGIIDRRLQGPCLQEENRSI